MRRVDPQVYTEEYYLTDCTGHQEYKESFGEVLEIRLQELTKYFHISPGMRVLDIGCGRGEHGADAVGIDYAKDAIKLAKILKSKQSKKLASKMSFYEMDAKRLAFKTSSFDAVILTDVVEHLYPEELDKVFKEIKRILKKDGKVIIHTAPNKWFNDIGYKYYAYPISSLFVSIWNILLRRSYPNIAHPKSLRADSHAIMHINEPTYFSLHKLYRKHNFSGEVFSSNITSKKPVLSSKDSIFNFFVFLHPLSKRFPLNIFLGSDFLSVLTNKK